MELEEVLRVFPVGSAGEATARHYYEGAILVVRFEQREFSVG